MIVLSGTIGAGKTSMAKMLNKSFEDLGYDSIVFYEPVDNNPVLPEFYKDPKKYAFLLQVYFLNKRLEGIESATNNLDIIDRSIFEDELMFNLITDQGNATKEEFNIYSALVNNIMEKTGNISKDPDLLIQIQVSFDTMLKRIKKRGRDYEQIENNPDLKEYYKELNNRYNKWFDDYDRSPKLKINGDELDFIESEDSKNKVLELIHNKINDLNIKNQKR